MRKIFIILLVVFLAIPCGCRAKNADEPILVSKELADIIPDLIAAYEKTGKAEIKTVSQAEADIFTVSLDSDSGDCADLKNEPILSEVFDKSLTLFKDGKVYGLPLYCRCYGIAYRTDILDKYFSLETRDAPYRAAERIDTFEKLKEVCEDILKHKSSLNIDGVFLGKMFSDTAACDLLSIPVYAELNENDDYDNPLFAAKNAKQLALRYGEYAENLMSLLKKYSAESGEYCFKIADAESTERLSYIALSDEGGEPFLLAGSDYFIAKRNNISASKNEIITDFLKFIIKNANDGFVPYKSAKNTKTDLIKSAARIFSGGKVKALPVISAAFPESLKQNAADILNSFISGKNDWINTEKQLKLLWKNERAN